ncbi:MAG: hypothetical protein JWS12_631 [Candidatus Saccharibacteria bacterium]|nr:hypothetical protein [Candidatus Saccharibacteria bacterium]
MADNESQIPGPPPLPHDSADEKGQPKAVPVHTHPPTHQPEPAASASLPAPRSRSLDDDLSAPLNMPEDASPPAPVSKKPKTPMPIGKIVVGLLVLILLAGGGYGGYKFWWSKRNKPAVTPTAAKSTASSPAPSTAKTSDVPDVTGTKKYTNAALSLTLNYPSTWTATDGTDGGVRFVSPDFTYKTTNKGTLTGNFRIYIRQGARPPDSKYIGRGVAIQPSEQLTYTQPTSSQRKQTYVSFFGLDTADNFAYFFVAGNFNLKKDDTLGPNYGKEADTYIISGGYSAKDLVDDMATNTVPTTSFQTTKAYKQAIDIIKSLQLQ